MFQGNIVQAVPDLRAQFVPENVYKSLAINLLFIMGVPFPLLKCT